VIAELDTPALDEAGAIMNHQETNTGAHRAAHRDSEPSLGGAARLRLHRQADPAGLGH
jgi:hypothetical protein